MSAQRIKVALAVVSIAVLLPAAVYVVAQRVGENRVGSSMDRAIPNPMIDVHESHEFEKAYLREHFRGFGFAGHATVEGNTPDTMYSMWEITVRGRRREIWFDVTPSFREVTKDM